MLDNIPPAVKTGLAVFLILLFIFLLYLNM